MILFYETMTRKILGESAPLAHTVLELSEYARRIFFDILRNQAKNLAKELPFIDPALEPLDQVYRILNQLVNI